MDRVEINIDEVIRLTKEEHKTPEEIAVLFNVSGGAIRKRLKQVNVEPYRKIAKKSPELLATIKEYLDEGWTNSKIAKELHMSPTTVRKYTYELGYDTNSLRTKTLTKKEITLTQEQWEVLYGSLLGDMSIDTNLKNSRPVISQGGKQEPYFNHKCEIFKNLIGKPNKEDRYDKRTNKWYHKYCVKFLTNPIYTELKKKLYPNGVKTVTQEWLDKVTPRGLAFWFMDDGTNSGEIATNSFSLEECKLIIKWFDDKWGIKCSLHTQHKDTDPQYLVYILTESRPTFYELVRPYFIDSMLYKLENWNLKKIA